MMKNHRSAKRFYGCLLSILIFLRTFSANALIQDEQNTIEIVNRSVNSVVFIINVALAQDYNFAQVEVPRGSGTGFVWDAEGHIVTNNHVVAGGDTFYVIFKDRTRLKAKRVGIAPKKDLAVLKLEGMDSKKILVPLKLGESDKLQVGQKTIAIGNPYGLDYSVTTGIISALGRQIGTNEDVTIRDVIQTDAAINKGNSGGPLLDSSGLLIGVNTAIFSESGGSSGIGFAIPVAYVKRIIPQLIKHKKVIQPGLGIQIVNDRVAREILDVPGVIIYGVEPGSPAEKAGLRGMGMDRFGRQIVGDVIVAINGHNINSFDELYNTLDRYNVGDEVKVKILRGEKHLVVNMRLQAL